MALSKQFWVFVIFTGYTLAIIMGMLIGDGLTIEKLRHAMEDEGLVFCKPEYPLGFNVEPFAIPTNHTWDDLGFGADK